MNQPIYINSKCIGNPLSCPLYSLYDELRTDYFSKLNITNEALSSSTSTEKILTICTVVNQAILAEYIFKCNGKRKEMLNL